MKSVKQKESLHGLDVFIRDVKKCSPEDEEKKVKKEQAKIRYLFCLFYFVYFIPTAYNNKGRKFMNKKISMAQQDVNMSPRCCSCL